MYADRIALHYFQPMNKTPEKQYWSAKSQYECISFNACLCLLIGILVIEYYSCACNTQRSEPVAIGSNDLYCLLLIVLSVL